MELRTKSDQRHGKLTWESAWGIKESQEIVLEGKGLRSTCSQGGYEGAKDKGAMARSPGDKMCPVKLGNLFHGAGNSQEENP